MAVSRTPRFAAIKWSLYHMRNRSLPDVETDGRYRACLSRYLMSACGKVNGFGPPLTAAEERGTHGRR